jgi:hypothetical protein
MVAPLLFHEASLRRHPTRLNKAQTSWLCIRLGRMIAICVACVSNFHAKNLEDK